MPVAEITRAETRERARLLSVDSYDVSLDLTGGGEVFGSASVIRFSCAEPGAGSYADLVARSVREITLNGVVLDPAQVWADGRIALPGLAASNELRVVADCEFSHDAKGLHRSQDSADGKVYAYTKFEPAAARRAFANFEQPDLKAAFTFHVTAPAGWTVLSNQPAPEPVPGPGPEVATWHFPPTPRISTYLTCVVAGDYHRVEGTHTTPQGQVIPLGLACRASLAAHLEADDMFTVTGQGLDYFTALFGQDYPFEKYDQVFVPEFSSGAMEQPGCVTFTERLLFRSRVTDAMYEVRAEVILHEMAHMWFGDLVTMKWFDDLWLNESFADYCAVLSSCEATRFTDAWTTFSVSRKTWGYMQDQLPSTHPIAADVPTVTAAVANFDGISYAKGASVLAQLAAFLGRDAFFDGIRSYLCEHAWENATLADLLTALSASSGTDLADWSKVWLETAGPNTLRPEFEVGENGAFTKFEVVQAAPAAHSVLRPHHIAVGLYNRAGPGDGELVRTGQVRVDVAGARTSVPELTGLPQPDLVLLNDEDLGYAIVRFDERSLRTVTESISALRDSLARVVCWSAVLDMASQAELSVPAFTEMLARALPAESSISVVQLLASKAENLIATLAGPAWVPAGKEQLAAVALPLLRAAEAGSDHQLAWVQLLSWTATTPEQLDLLAGLLAGTQELPGLVVDTELRWALLLRLAATGRAGDAQIDAELARDTTDAGQRSALTCRAAIPDAAHKAEAWRQLTGATELGYQGVLEVAAGFNLTEQASLLGPYRDKYFDLLPEIWAGRSAQLRLMLGQRLFPYWAASPQLLARIEEFLRAEKRDPGLVRLLTERRDVAERAIRSRHLG